MNSLGRRLLLASGVLLIIFLGVTGLVLDNAFRHSALSAVQDRLQAIVYTLLAAAEPTPEGSLQMPPELPEVRFNTPQSGLYAQVLSEQGPLWKSPSALGMNLPKVSAAKTGVGEFSQQHTSHGMTVFALVFDVLWEDTQQKARRYSIQVFEDKNSFENQVQGFRKSLWGWLILVAVLLEVALTLVLRWGLSPLRCVVDDLEQIKQGHQKKLTASYPDELQPFADSINSFIQSERGQRDRYRNSLGDIAHSLKTPLAVVRTLAEQQDIPEETRTQLKEQAVRMTQIVDYQLQRASARGKVVLGQRVALKQIVIRLRDTLDKVYAERGLSCKINIADEITFPGDQGDLMELIGNILDNAYKYTNNKISVSAYRQKDQKTVQEQLLIQVDDDGPGLDPKLADQLLKRGVRFDEQVEGQGIGLAVVRDILQSYDGQLHLSKSPLGGVRVEIIIPLTT